jgi:outer membrane protein OmpA-like peptidoglycan-associated protein
VAAHVPRADQELPHGNQNAGQCESLSLRAQGEAEKQRPESAGSRPSSPVSQSNCIGVRAPPFLKRVLLFGPDSAEPSVESRNAIKLVASWLREHREVRILIVGFCDLSGSEVCTHALAERGGTVVEQPLVKDGSGSSQIVQGWERAGPVCSAATPACQAMNRRARIFIVGPVH